MKLPSKEATFTFSSSESVVLHLGHSFSSRCSSQAFIHGSHAITDLQHQKKNVI